ncbi:hypothetical protein SEA_ALI17_60 [Gordonia phage Ali17]|uniref:Uncharacterized protein n=1 Tax=Gordonia phage Ali17 TaxID=2301561 RepID=A0A385DN01_9CAUD|nr:hypothetical protein J1772_gp60 [Gordonia phage Ali17]AXQ60676.1 hypothetical protein SEA_ALI17_60 [Gordonia phage Ali17]
MTIEPAPVQSLVDDIINRFARDSQRYPNVVEIPESASPALHQLAAEVYAMGYADGVNVEGNRQYNAIRRNSDRDKHAAEQADKADQDAAEFIEAHRSLAEQGRTV